MTVSVDERTGAIVVPGTTISTEWIEVTPKLAAQWLKANTKNRHVRPKHLKRLEKDMLGGKFVITHQGVAICEDGTLIDGQHRLASIVETKTSQWLLVTQGLPMEAQQFVDNGARRAPADLGPLKENGYGAMKAAAIKLLLTIEDLEHKVSPTEIQQMASEYTYGDLVQGYVRYEEMLDKHLDLARAAAKDMTGRVGASQLLASAVYYPESATDFLSGVATGANLDQGDARLALRKFRGTGRVQTPVSAFAALKAARYFYYERPLTVVRWRWNEQMDLAKKPQESKPWGGNKKNGKNTGEEGDDE
jgi:hypothetical protein